MRGYRPTTSANPTDEKPPKRGEEECGPPSPRRQMGPPTIEGMPMRDWLAVHASEVDIDRWRGWHLNTLGVKQMPLRTVEQARYAYADAMLAAREGK